MSDYLLELQENTLTKRILSSLPITVPSKLPRKNDAWSNLPLLGSNVLFVGEGILGDTAVAVAAEFGATLFSKDPSPARSKIASGWSRDFLEKEELVDGIVVDLTRVERLRELACLPTELAPALSRLRTGGRVVLLHRSTKNSDDEEKCAVAGGLDGFCRSLAKELGRKGSRANRLVVENRAEGHMASSLLFLLSARSAFVSGQTIEVSKSPKKRQRKFHAKSLLTKTVLVTGAAQGIGRSTARRLAEEGVMVVGLDRPAAKQKLELAMAEIGGRSVLADLSLEGVDEEVSAQIPDNSIDAVVHNAGVTRDRIFKKMSEDEWNAVIDINVRNLMAVDQVLRNCKLKDDGRIVYLSSVSGIAGNAGQTNYATSKAGLLSYMQLVAAKERSRGITANAVAPGFIETKMTSKMPAMMREGARRLSALGQGGLPQDVAEAITYFLLPSSYAISGQTLRVCGLALIGR